MIQITVKTLDGVDRKFDVPGQLTIQEFKERIAPVVNITALNQRLIYHGRVLPDEKVLNASDLDGKTLHLVQKLPGQSPELPQNNVLTDRQEVSEQQIVVGNVIVPVGNLNIQNFMDSIHRILNRLGEVGRRATVNVGPQNADESVAVNIILRDDPNLQVIESPAFARLHHLEHLLSRMNHSLFHIEQQRSLREENDDHDPSKSEQRLTENSDNKPALSEPKSIEHATSSENVARSSQRSDFHDEQRTSEHPTARHFTSNVREASVNYYASVVGSVLSLQERLQPHMQHYLALLGNEEDYSRDEERGRQVSGFFSSMQMILHDLSHVYHVLSDLNIHFCRPPPRLVAPLAVRQPNTSIQAPEAHITINFVRATDAEAYQQFEQLLNAVNMAPIRSTTPQQQPSVRVVTPLVQQTPAPPQNQSVERQQTSVFQRFFNNFLPGAAGNTASLQPQGASTSSGQVRMGFVTDPAVASATTQGRARTSSATNPPIAFPHPVIPGFVPRQAGGFMIPPVNSNVVMQLFRPGFDTTMRNGAPLVSPHRLQSPAGLRTVLTPRAAAAGQITLNSPRIDGNFAPIVTPFAFEQSTQGPNLTSFNVDPFLPCSSRHFNPRNRSSGPRARQPRDSSSAVPQVRSDAAVTSVANVDEETLDVMEFESATEHLLRSTLEAMRTHPASAPSSVHVGIHSQTAAFNVPVTLSGGAGVVQSLQSQSAPAAAASEQAENASSSQAVATPAARAEKQERDEATSDGLPANTVQEANQASDEQGKEIVGQKENEDWKSQVPEDWVTVIETDIERQRSSPPQQAPFSDAYLSGMPLKRRKMIADNKTNLNTNLAKLIDESAGKVCEQAGVSKQSGENPQMNEALMESFKQNIKDKIQSRACVDPNFDPERFKDASSFLRDALP